MLGAEEGTRRSHIARIPVEMGKLLYVEALEIAWAYTGMYLCRPSYAAKTRFYRALPRSGIFGLLCRLNRGGENSRTTRSPKPLA